MAASAVDDVATVNGIDTILANVWVHFSSMANQLLSVAEEVY